MMLLTEVILAKIQTNPTTPSTPSGTDAVLVSNIQHGYHNARMHTRSVVKNTIGKYKQLFGGTLVTISFDVEVKGSGTAGTAPEFDELLRACAIAVTNVVSTSDTYAPISDDATMEYVTIYYHQDGKRKVLENAVGTVSMDADVGAPGMLHFNFFGHEGTETDTAIVAPTYDSTVPKVYISAAFSVGSYSAIISKFSMDTGNVVATPADVSAANGFGRVRITDRDVSGSFDPESVLLAANDFVADWKSDAAMAFDSGVVGSVAGNKWQLEMPAISYREISEGERDGIRALETGYGAAEVSGDDEFSLAFT